LTQADDRLCVNCECTNTAAAAVANI